MPRRPARFAVCTITTVVTLLLAGCAAAGHDYARPQMPTPPQYRFTDGTTEAESLADLPWWQVFDDPALQALVREAIANNLDLRAALARVERARAHAGIAKDAILVGSLTKFNLYAPSRWEKVEARTSGENFGDLMRRIGLPP